MKFKERNLGTPVIAENLRRSMAVGGKVPAAIITLFPDDLLCHVYFEGVWHWNSQEPEEDPVLFATDCIEKLLELVSTYEANGAKL